MRKRCIGLRAVTGGFSLARLSGLAAKSNPIQVISMKRALPTLLVGLVVVFAACASSQTGESRSRSDLITLEEIEEEGLVFNTAFDVVRHFRPHWLHKRGNVNITTGGGTEMLDYVVIYEDGQRLGDPETLLGIPAQSVQEIQHYNPAQAQRLGPFGHPHGAILVRTKSG